MDEADALAGLRSRLAREGSVSFIVRARPGAPRSRVTDIMADGSVKIDVAAAPEEGKANAALLAFLADAFGVPKSRVELLSGQTGRRKAVRITA